MILDTSTRILDSGATVFAMRGRLSLGNTLLSIEHALDQLAAGGTRNLIIDVSGLDQIDSAGLGVLIAISGRVEHAGGRVAIAGAKGMVAKSFEIVHMERVVPVFPGVETAEAALATGSGSHQAAPGAQS